MLSSLSAGVEDYLSTLPDHALPYLDHELDEDNEGVERDLSEIAKEMLKWEEQLSTYLQLTPIDINDIKEKHSEPVLRRYSCRGDLYCITDFILQMWGIENMEK